MSVALDVGPKAVLPADHRFGQGPEYLVGLEEELMLVDAGTYALAPAIEAVAAAAALPRQVKPELMQGQVELATAPARSVAELRAELVELRGAVVRAAADEGARIVGAGTHPFAMAEDEPLTRRDRYRELAAELRYPLRRTLCFGLHVHVSIGGADKVVAVLEELVPYLPLLLAASASSPFWRGEASGLASTRTSVFQAMPRSGLPPTFASYDDYARQLEALRAAGAVADHSHVWWDARPHPRFGTIEVRIMDAQPDLDDTIALAALVQSLVRHLGEAYDRGARRPPAPRAVIGENRWLAARHGLRAPLVDAAAMAAVPARVVLERLLDDLADDAAALDCREPLERLRGRTETSADRQRLAHRRGDTLPTILDRLADETAAAAP